VYLYGHSSGAAIALGAVIKLRKEVRKLAIYEAPFALDGDARKAAKEYNRMLKKLLKSGRNGDAVVLFIRSVGVSDKQIQAIRRMPMWRGLETMAPTLAYDSDVLGEGHSLPTALLAGITTPTLVMHGGAGAPFMREAALAISETIPNAQLRTLPGQTHGVRPKALVPILVEFFA
jgi:pimeloyl-ACP methyl ester carboxylesterase